jgi:putative spermidine/putrescine transport system permease protein
MALTIPLAYAVAIVYLQSSRSGRIAIVLMLALPLLTSSVVRTFAWVAILGRQGLVNELLLATGMTSAPVRLLYDRTMLTVALAQIELPLMTLPIIVSLARLDPNLISAAESLGAGRWRIFLGVVVPLSFPGVAAGAVLVFAGATSAIITHTLVGGGTMLFMPYHIYQQAMQATDWPFAAALGVALILTVSIFIAVALPFTRRGASHA